LSEREARRWLISQDTAADRMHACSRQGCGGILIGLASAIRRGAGSRTLPYSLAARLARCRAAADRMLRREWFADDAIPSGAAR
jgi:hypothetical protein